MPRYPSRELANASTEGVAAVDRALLLLTAFREGDRSLGLGDLVERTGLVKSTALRLLASLQHFGLLQRLDDGRYALGAEVARLSGIYTASFSLEAIVMPALRELVRKTRESAVYHVRQGDARLCLYRVASPQPIRDHAQVGDLFPLDRGAGGRVISAFGGGKSALHARIRKAGFAALVGDRTPEVAGIAAPVFGSQGELAGAVTLTMPSSRFDESHVAPTRDAARAISEKLGYAG